MKFRYDKQPNPLSPIQPWTLRPYIPVRLLHHNAQYDLLALVDSGADISLFHASVGTLLGIDVRTGKREKVYGIAGVDVDAYVHTIHLQLHGSNTTIALDAWFTEARAVKAILGQGDFFEQHRITFERAKERIEIVPAKK